MGAIYPRQPCPPIVSARALIKDSDVKTSPAIAVPHRSRELQVGLCSLCMFGLAERLIDGEGRNLPFGLCTELSHAGDNGGAERTVPRSPKGFG